MLTKNKAKGIQKNLNKSVTRTPNLSRTNETDTRNRTWVNPDMVQLQMLEELKFIADNLGHEVEEKPVALKDMLVMVGEDPRPDENYDPVQLQKGVVSELEHTNNAKIARKIAKDHLDEFSDYYSRLETIEQ